MRQSRVIDNIFDDAIFQLEKEWKNHSYGDELFRDESSVAAVTQDHSSNTQSPATSISSATANTLVDEEEDLSALLAECREEFHPSDELEDPVAEDEEEDLSALLAECREEFRPSDESEDPVAEDEEEDLSALLAECREEFRPSDESDDSAVEDEEEDLSALLAECREEFRPSDESEDTAAEDKEEDLSALLAECREEFRPSDESEDTAAEDKEEDLSALLAECREEFRPSDESDDSAAEDEEEDLSALLAECREEFRPSDESDDSAVEDEEEDLSALLAECREEFRPSGESEDTAAEDEEEDLSALLAECRDEFRPSGEFKGSADVIDDFSEDFSNFDEDDSWSFDVDSDEDVVTAESSDTEIIINVDGRRIDDKGHDSNWITKDSSLKGDDSGWIVNDSYFGGTESRTDVYDEPEDYAVTDKIDDDDLDIDDASSEFESDEDLDSLLDDLTNDSAFSGMDEEDEDELEDALNEAISSLEDNSDSLESGSIGDLMESAFDIDSEFDEEKEEAAAAEVGGEPSLNAFDFDDTSDLLELDDSGLDDDSEAEEKSREFFDELDSEIDSIVSHPGEDDFEDLSEEDDDSDIVSDYDEEDGDEDFVVGVKTVPVPKPSIELVEDIDDVDVDKMLVDMGFGNDGLLHNKFGPDKEKLLGHLIQRFEYLARKKLDSFPEAQAALVKNINLRIEIDLKFGEFSTDGEDDSLFSLDM